MNEALQQLAQNLGQPLTSLLGVLDSVRSLAQNPVSVPAPQSRVSSGPSGDDQARIQANLDLAKSLPQPVRTLLVDALADFVSPSTQQPVTAGQVAEAARQMAQSLLDSQSSLAQNVKMLASELAPAASAASSSTPPDTVNLARQYLASLADDLGASLSQEPIQSQASLNGVLGSRGFMPPQTSLASLPKEAVMEAVVFLQARGLPVKPALVEPVALALTLENGPVQQMNNLNESLARLDANLLASRPELKQAVQNFQDLFDSLAVKVESGRATAAQLSDLITPSGLQLEARLAKEVLSPKDSAFNASLDKTDLKASLLKLQRQISQALADTGVELSSRATLEKAASQTQSALSTLTAQQLVNQPLASREWVSFQVPLWFGQAVVPGQLSVYWKKGSEPRLSDSEPLNVVFNLDTRGLGAVKAFLAIYKTECFCQVRVARQDSLKLIKDHLEELRDSFSSNTPFNLSQLDAVLDEGNGQPLFPEASPFVSSQGVSLSA